MPCFFFLNFFKKKGHWCSLKLKDHVLMTDEHIIYDDGAKIPITVSQTMSGETKVTAEYEVGTFTGIVSKIEQKTLITWDNDAIWVFQGLEFNNDNNNNENSNVLFHEKPENVFYILFNMPFRKIEITKYSGVNPYMFGEDAQVMG